MFKTFVHSLRTFGRHDKGNVAILFGLALIPILLAGGAAIDYGRALIVRERIADAADAAALAIGSWPGLSQSELQTKAQQFFDANYPPSRIGTVGKINVALAGDDIKVNVKGEVPTTFMRLANVDSIGIDVDATVTKKQRNIEVALVLDTTGSMGSGGKMAAMQSAAKKMVQTLFDGHSTSDSLKVAVVPFAAAVNVGKDKKNDSWIDSKSKSAVAQEDFDFAPKETTFDLYEELEEVRSKWDWAGCVRERDGDDYELTDAVPNSSVSASLFAPYLAPDEPDRDHDDGDRYNNSYIEDNPCTGTDALDYQRCTRKYDDDADLDDDDAPGPNAYCPPNPIRSLNNNQGQVISTIETLKPNGNTVIPAGLLWGWRVLSPTSPYTEGKAYDDEKWVKAIVLLTDGENNVDGGNGNENGSSYNAFGYANQGHLGKKSGSNATSNLNNKLATVCSNVKAKGIRLYTIGFQINDSTTRNLLRNCATKTDMYYNSPSNDQLAGIFQDIAQGLSELRIAQ